MKAYRARRTFVVGITVLIAATLIPLHSSPVTAATSDQKQTTASYLFDKDETKVVPKTPEGEFSSPPPEYPAEPKESTGEGRLVEQSETKDLFLNSNGSYTAKVHTQPVNHKSKDGKWRKFDSALKEKNGRQEADLGEVQVSLGGSTDDADLVKVTMEDSSLVLTPKARQAGKTAAKVEGENKVTYQSAFENADLSYDVTPSRIKEKITLSAAPTTAPVYDFDFKAQGFDVTTDDKGTIVLSKDKVEILTIPQGISIDAKGATSAVRVELDNNTLRLTPDFEWLKTASYPTVVDPDIWVSFAKRNSYGVGDAFVSSANPTQNYNGSGQIDSNAYSLKVGYNPYPGNEFNSYLMYDLSSLAGKVVAEARLEMKPYAIGGPGDGITVWPVSQQWWDNQVTFNNRPNHRTEKKVWENFTANQWKTLDVTDWAQHWINPDPWNLWPNYGFSFDTEGVDSYVRFAGVDQSWLNDDPVLAINYTTQPPAPTLTAPADGASLMTTTPTLSGNTVTDPDGDYVYYWFRVSDSNDPERGSQVNSGWLSSPTWTPPVGSLQDGVTYTWKLIVADFTNPWPENAKAFNESAPRKLKINMRLGDQTASPDDTFGPTTVNLVNGNMSTSTSSPSFSTVGGSIGLSYTYNHQGPAEQGLTGKYYPGCDGTTHDPVTSPYLVRLDPRVDFSWGDGSPTPSIGADNFCEEWSGTVTVPSSGNYCFQTVADDGSRVWVGGQQVVNRWIDQSNGSPDWGSAGCKSITGSASIVVKHYEHVGGAHMQLWVKNPAGDAFIIPSDWLSPGSPVLPRGWKLSADVDGTLSYVSATVTSNSIVLNDASGKTYEFKRKDPNNAFAGYTPPTDDNSILTMLSNGALQVTGQDGQLYNFDSSGVLLSVQSVSDIKAPAAPEYIYDSSSGVAKLSQIKDPVTGRKISLIYSGSGSCPQNTVSPFDAYPPPGMLCKVDYNDFLPGQATLFKYWAGYLVEIIDPGDEYTNFGYHGGLLDGLVDPLQNDRNREYPTTNYYTHVNYSSNKTQSVLLASPDGTDTHDTESTSVNRPWHSYGYPTPYSPTANGESRLYVGGINALGNPNDWYRKVIFDSNARTVTNTDYGNVTTTTTWDDKDNLTSTKNGATGRMSTTIYDADRNLPTDTYGPAPYQCFQANLRPITSGVTGCTNPGIVAHTNTEYDGGINGLAIAWWDNENMIGPAKAYSTSIRDDKAPQLDANWANGSPSYISPDYDYWSFRATGSINLTALGNYTFTVALDNTVKMWIDDTLVMDKGWPLVSPTAVFNNTRIGWHKIRYEFRELDGLAFTQLAWNPPSVGGAPVVVPSTSLRPDYNLATKTTADDSTTGASISTASYSNSTTDPAFGLSLSSTEDPTGLALSTTSTYEDLWTSGDKKFFRKLSRTLPGGNTYNYTYYSVASNGTLETKDNPCTVANDPIAQPGMTKTSAAPDGRTQEFVYDTAHRVIATRYSTDTIWNCTTYDNRGRVAEKKFPAFGAEVARTVTYSYKVSGNSLVSSVTDANGTIQTTLDGLGRTVVYKDAWDKVTNTSYDLAGRQTSTDTPLLSDYRSVTYDSASRVASQKAGNNAGSALTLATVGYDGTTKEMTSVTFPTGTGNGGNGTVHYMSRDEVGRIKAINAFKGSTSIVRDEAWYSQSGDLINSELDDYDPGSGVNNYVYDGAGRLTSAKVARSTATTLASDTYTYGFAATSCTGYTGVNNDANKNSNRTSTAINGGTATTYCYNNADQLKSTTDTRYSTPVYDAHGNTTSMGSSAMTYDVADRHMTTTDSGSTIAYKRDAQDRVIERTVSTGSGGYATISLRASATAQNGSGATTVVVNKPTGTVQDDVMLAQVAVNAGTSSAITPPAGWTQITNRVNNDLLRSAIFWKAAGSSEPSSYTFTIDSSRQATAAITSYSGVNTTNPINAWGSNNSTAAQNWFQNGSITTTVANALEVSYCAVNSNPTIWQGNNQTERYELATTSNGISMNMSDRLFPTAGATGNVSGSFPTNANSVSQMLALTPASTSSTVTSQVRYVYRDGSDSPEITIDISGNVLDKNYSLMGGITKSVRGATTTWNYPNIHGDVAAITDNSGTKQGKTITYDPFGQLIGTQGLADNSSGDFDYGWLGTKQRGLEHEGSLFTIEMGVRQYVPGLGRFLEVDPVEGGSANDYDYCDGEPIGCTDLDGNRSFWQKATKFVKDHAVEIAVVVAVVAVVAVTCASAVGCGPAIAAGAAVARAVVASSARAVSATASRTAISAATKIGPAIASTPLVGTKSRLFGNVSLGAKAEGLFNKRSMSTRIGWGVKKVNDQTVKVFRLYSDRLKARNGNGHVDFFEGGPT